MALLLGSLSIYGLWNRKSHNFMLTLKKSKYAPKDRLCVFTEVMSVTEVHSSVEQYER